MKKKIIFFLIIFLYSINALPTAFSETIKEHNAPRLHKQGILFTFKMDKAVKVYLAGSFNNWANNQNGKVTDEAFAMDKGDNHIWWKIIKIKPGPQRYKFVVLTQTGQYIWYPDPFVKETDKDNNSVFDFRKLISAQAKERKLIKGRKLKPHQNQISSDNQDIFIKDIFLHKVWIQPGEENMVTVLISDEKKKAEQHSLSFIVKSIDGRILDTQKKNIKQKVDFKIKEFPEGAYVIECLLKEKDKLISRKQEVLSVVREIADDLRYGFYANWDKMGQDYIKKADYFAELYINAIEYYDYFPAHGYYAPKEKIYQFDPFFGRDIYAEDIRQKIDSAYQRNILSIAYVAAYAASKSIYKNYPYPMTDQQGSIRIFNGQVMTEPEAVQQNKPVWFYLMAIADDSFWYPYIMSEMERTLDNSPDDLVSFHGFEIDSYGHASDDRYYSTGSRYNGRLLSEVIMNLVKDIRIMTHKLKKKSAISFNCVNEYGIDKMYDVVDFLFIENWSGYKSGLDDLIDICYEHRTIKNQRVILKLYPADMQLKQTCWPAENLKYILGAAMTGGGSIMVAGEPDEVKQEMHALNTLYYPDNVSMPEENFQILKDYYFVDSLLYGLNHGRMVDNLDSDFQLPDCIIRCYDSRKNFITLAILHNADNVQWNKKLVFPQVKINYEIAFPIPDKKPAAVFYCSPDFQDLLIPVPLDWEYKDGYVRILIPRLAVFGVVLIQYQ